MHKWPNPRNVHRAYKICSNESLISDEMRKIRKFMSWNGFPKTLTNKLIHKFTPKADQAYMSSNINNHIEDQTEQVVKFMFDFHTYVNAELTLCTNSN
jgi:hypothetical protein